MIGAELVPFLFVAAGVGLSLLGRAAYRSRMRSVLPERWAFARQHGLRCDAKGVISGEVHGFPVVISERPPGGSAAAGVEFATVLPWRGMTIRPERGLEAAAQAIFGVGELQVGDPEFDRKLSLSGAEHQLRALLDAATRRALLDARGELEAYGRLNVIVPDSDPEMMSRGFTAFARILEALPQPDEPLMDRLVQIARSDPEVDVRFGALQVVMGMAPEGVRNRLAYDVVDDPDHRIRLAGAQVLADRHTALAIATDTTAGRQVQIDALRVWHGCGVPRPELAEGTLRMLDADWSSVVVAAAQSVARLGIEEAEPALIGLLGHANRKVRLAAIRSLAVVGSVRAVEPLLDAADGASALSGTRSEARSAARAVQARLDGAEAGGLAMVDVPEPAGQLTLSEASERGGLELADRDEPARRAAVSKTGSEER